MNKRAEVLLLHQFRTSPFNEKVRWALAFKDLPYQQVSYVPGAHREALRRLSGQTATPVVQAGTRVIAGSAAIIEFLERLRPAPALYPAHVTDRSRALEVQRSWDLQMGPAARTLLFAAAATAMDSAAPRTPGRTPGRTPSRTDGTRDRQHYWTVVAFLGGVDATQAAQAGDVYWPDGPDQPAKVVAARDAVSRGLDWLAASINADQQLITAAFTVADLTCAALLTPLIDLDAAGADLDAAGADLDAPGAAADAATPEPVRALRVHYREHPAVQWVLGQYRRHWPERAT